MWFTAKYDILLEKILLEISVYVPFPAKDGGKRVGVDVHVYLKKADAYGHTFPRFFSLLGAYTAMLGNRQFLFQKKNPHKNS